MENLLVTIIDIFINSINHFIDYKNIYLIGTSIILTAIIWLTSKIRFDKIVEFIFHISLAILLGFLIKNLSNDTLLSFISENKGISLIIFGFFLLIFLKEIFSYSKAKKQVVYNFLKAVYTLSLIFLALFIAIDANIFLNLYISVTLFSIWSFLNNKKENKNNKSKNNEISDNPIISYDALFPTRKKECSRIFNYIQNLDTDDPYAIAINAEWGEGKTSLINALKEQMEHDQNRKNNIIFIQPMILDTREKLLRYVFEQLETILIQNKIYTGKGSPYKQYFNLLLKFIDNKSISSLTSFFEVFSNENRPDLREYKLKLEKNIEYLIAEKQRIYIIVDDLDRVEEETVRGTLTFIKEIANLKGITVLFLVDYKKIISDNISLEYLEKFINEKFDLIKVNYNELFNHYLEILIPIYELEETKEEVKILREKYEAYLKKIDTYIKQATSSLTEKIEEIKSSDQVDSPKDNLKLKESENRQECLLNQSLDYENKIRNARYVKKIISGVKQGFIFFEENFKKEADTLVIKNKNLSLNELIFKLNIFKVLFKKEYDEIIKSGDIKDYISESKSEFVKSFFRESEKRILVYEKEVLLNDMKFDFYNRLIFSDEISKEIYEEIKTENEKIIEEIDLSIINEVTLNFEKVTKYIRAINFTSGSEVQEINIQRLEKFTNLTMSLLENNKIKLNNIL